MSTAGAGVDVASGPTRPGRRSGGGSSGGAAAERRSAARPLDVYLVEDNLLVLENLIAALEELAPVHVVGTAADEEVATDWLRPDGQACDLVIVDIFLRTGSGLGVIEGASRRRPNAAIVVLSNYATAEMRARCLASGADRVFDKSRDIDQLVDYCVALAAHDGGAGEGRAPH